MKRRKAIQQAGLGALALSGLGAISISSAKPAVNPRASMRKINVFSKHLHWLGYDDMAKQVKEIGFDGIDLTVRPNGHVLPENVEKDLPSVANAAAKHGVDLEMMTTAIKSADDPFTEKILKTASDVGITVYRLGWYKYDFAKPIMKNLEQFGEELKKIGELNAKYSIIGDYQNHAGTSAGSPVWDIKQMLDVADSKYIGVQYDIRHAVAEGLKSWPLGLRLLAPHIHSLDIKDVEYVKTDNGWDIKHVPLGQGAVDFKAYFSLLDELNVEAPISIHYEYPLGGADKGRFELTIPGEKVVEAMKKDLAYLKSVM